MATHKAFPVKNNLIWIVTLALPAEFERHMSARLGKSYVDFKESLVKPPVVSVRLNPAKVDQYPGERIPWCEFGRYLTERPSFTLDPKFHAGAYYVQEASSMFLEQAVRKVSGGSQPIVALDLCASPGGKSTHLLSLLGKESLLISNETIRSRTSALVENLQKWGCDNVIATSNDPSAFQRVPGMFDLIVLDAPCSGEGLFRKDPSSVASWSAGNVEHCALRQQRIIEDIWPSLKQNGVLIYSTCTFNEKENIDNMRWLASHHGTEFVDLAPSPGWGIETIEHGKAIGCQFFPHKTRGEGFFLAALRKTDTSETVSTNRLNFQAPGNKQLTEISPWIRDAESKFFIQHQQQVRMMPGNHRGSFQSVMNNLTVISAGTPVAEITRNKLVPEHAFALSVHLNKGAVNKIYVSREEALSYLRKDNIQLSMDQKGFALIEHEGLGLGWVNVLQNRINNLYPAGWRIRMERE
jgi:16S rRNA C967 or C1407 C5-methylase (RsmB/RsmF family)/NOL1/NOP2/fmu family ribosome biogenesis protein